MTSQPIIEYFANHSCNLTGLHIFCSNKYNVWYLLLATKVTKLNCPCPKCQTITNVLHHTCENYFNLVRFCPKCRIHFPLSSYNSKEISYRTTNFSGLSKLLGS